MGGVREGSFVAREGRRGRTAELHLEVVLLDGAEEGLEDVGQGLGDGGLVPRAGPWGEGGGDGGGGSVADPPGGKIIPTEKNKAQRLPPLLPAK